MRLRELYITGPVTGLAMQTRFQRQAHHTARPAPAINANCHPATSTPMGPGSYKLGQLSAAKN